MKIKDFDIDIKRRLNVLTVSAPNGVKIEKSSGNFEVEKEQKTPPKPNISRFSASGDALNQSKFGVTPKILVSNGLFGPELYADLKDLATDLRAIAVVESPSNSVSENKTVKFEVNSSRLYPCFPHVKDLKDRELSVGPFAAGTIARNDEEKGFWVSPSNKVVAGIRELTKDVSFSLSDENSDANKLNENNITTIIYKDGFRLWGNKTPAGSKDIEAANSFINERRITDAINDYLQESQFKRVDDNISKKFIQNVVADVNNYLRDLSSKGAILGGNCFVREEDNSNEDLRLGKVTFSIDYTPPKPAQTIRFKSIITDTYLSEVLS